MPADKSAPGIYFRHGAYLGDFRLSYRVDDGAKRTTRFVGDTDGLGGRYYPDWSVEESGLDMYRSLPLDNTRLAAIGAWQDAQSRKFVADFAAGASALMRVQGAGGTFDYTFDTAGIAPKLDALRDCYP